MATALDLLMSTKEDVNLLSEESDICTIDAKTRAIFVPSTIVVGGVQSDKNAERIKFSCPKIVGDNLDLSKFSVRINFKNVSSVDFNVSIKDQYICDDVAVDGENVTFSWLIGRNAARYMGTVRFIVCAVKTDSDSNISVEWNTAIAEVPVLEGIEIDQPQIGEQEKDIINQLLELTKNTSAEAVQNVNSAKEQAIKDIQSVSQPDTTLTIEGGLAEAKATGEAIDSLKEDLVNITNGVKPIHKNIVWQNGYIDNNGIVKKSSLSKYAVISLKSNETVLVGTLNANITMLGKTNSDTVSVGDTVTPIKITSPYDRFEDYTYYTLEDAKIVVCVLTSNYKLKFYEKPFFLNEDTKVFHVTDYVNGTYYNTGILGKSTNRVRTSNFLILNKGEAVDVKNIPYGYELAISFFDFNTKKLKYGDEWGGIYPYVAQEKILMLPLWRRTDNADLSPSEITGDVVIYGTCLTDIKYNDSVIANNLGIQDKINQANHYRRNNTKPLCLAHISDLHLDKIRLQRFTNFINNIKNIDDAICTGDMTNNYSDGMTYWDSVSGTERILTCIGNHDGLANHNVDWYSGQCTMLEAYNKFINPYISNWNVTHDVGKTYYYKDYNSEKIRLIVLDSMRSGTDATNQNTWLESVLSSAKSKGYSVVCATHCVPQTSKVNYIDCSFNSINLKYEDEYDTCVTNTIYQQTVQNFIDDDGKFITWICGHTHVDFVYTTSEFPNQLWIVVACGLLSNNFDIDRTDGTKNQDAFNILTFDTNTELVKVIRVGADRDRSMRHLGTMSIDYNTHSVIYND
nr:MAG TPA: putative phosphohydrolase [Bacteriophage sp.]